MILFQPTKIKGSKIHGSNSCFVFDHIKKIIKFNSQKRSDLLASRCITTILLICGKERSRFGVSKKSLGFQKQNIFLNTCPIILNSNCKNRQQRNFNWRTHAMGYRTPTFCKLCKTLNPFYARFTFQCICFFSESMIYSNTSFTTLRQGSPDTSLQRETQTADTTTQDCGRCLHYLLNYCARQV